MCCTASTSLRWRAVTSKSDFSKLCMAAQGKHSRVSPRFITEINLSLSPRSVSYHLLIFTTVVVCVSIIGHSPSAKQQHHLQSVGETSRNSAVTGQKSTMLHIIWISAKEHGSESARCHFFLQGTQ